MKDYVAENERILEEWRKSYVDANQSLYPNENNIGEKFFAPDGIMYKGEFKGEIKRFNNGHSIFRWKREESGKENEMWSNAPLRILYLTKDQNVYGDVAWDVRSESFRYRDEQYKPEEMWLDSQNTFFRNLVYSLYGIMNTTADSSMKYDGFTNEKALKFADKQIFARINCKKEVGSDRCYDSDLIRAIENDKKFLEQQIINLDADIFVCCGYSKFIEKSGNRMLNLLNEIGYHFEPAIDKKPDEWVYYDKSCDKLAINSYHLSYLQFDYNGMISAYSEFLKKHPTFTNSHREK